MHATPAALTRGPRRVRSAVGGSGERSLNISVATHYAWRAGPYGSTRNTRAKVTPVERDFVPMEAVDVFVGDHDEQVKTLCDSGLPDVEMCVLDDEPPEASTLEEALTRGRWLLGLLILQSTSSFVLDKYQDLVREHLVLTLFLTMLVGAGGNAGNQSAIKVIRGLATGVLPPTWPAMVSSLRQQSGVALLLGGGLSAGGFVRVYATCGELADALSISLSLLFIVMFSVILGTCLPFALTRAGVDPANAGTSIQVLMDILGVAIACITCTFIFSLLA